MKSNRPSRWMTFLATTLVGTAAMGTCETRLRDSIVDGTKAFVLNLFDPDNLTIDLTEE